METSTSKSSSTLCSAEHQRQYIILAYLILFLLTGLFLQPINELTSGLQNILKTSGILITDYIVIGGIGAALVNASLTTLLCHLLFVISKVPFQGAAIASLLTVFGFSLFGKNILTILPILLGVFLYARLCRQPYRTVAVTSLFATTLAPLVGEVSLNMGLGIGIGIAFGVVAGFLVAALSKQFYTFHEGHNLYNIGFTAGITGMILYSLLKMFGYQSQPVMIWGEQFDITVFIYLILVFGSMVLIGYYLKKTNTLSDRFLSLLNEPGVAPADFFSSHGSGVTFVNMGLMGFLGIGYLLLIGAPLNGPSIGALFTMAGFGAYGKHLKNTIPIMVGVYLAAVIYPVSSPTAPGAVLAALFGTTLAPMAGKYGFVVGVVSGLLHLIIVSNVGVLHGGMNLYNNGFSGGFVAIILLSLIKAFPSKK